MIDYIELHSHSNFSFLDGASHVEDLIRRAKSLGMRAIALTDHNGLYIAPTFFKLCKEEGIKPIIGAELTLKGGFHLLLIVKDKKGYSNLCRLITKSHMKGKKGNPLLEREDLKNHSEGLICLTGCKRGEIPSLLLQKREGEALGVAKNYMDIFGRENLFIELQNNFYPEDRNLIASLIRLSSSLGLRYVVTNNVHYAKKDGSRLHDVLTCIRERKTIDECKNLRLNGEFYLKSKEEIGRIFRDIPSGLSNTLLIADMCDFDLDFSSYRFPEPHLPEGELPDAYLRRICERRLKEKYGKMDTEIRSRLDRELDLIRKLNLSGYFLIVYDIMEFAKREGILAQGRGSAANSLVAYLLGITKVDPIKNRLFLGRFLNEEMSEIPDIDIDISTKKRERVIQYVYEKYGYERVAMVCTFVTYKARNAIREVGKVLGFDKDLLDRMAKSVSVYDSCDVEEDLKKLESFKRLFDSKKWQHFTSLLKEIADFPRHTSIHVGGMLISSSPLIDIVPLEKASMPGRIVCQWDKDGIQDAGLIKVDLLGLRMLSLIEDAKEEIEKNKKIKLDLDRIPLDDEKVYDMICNCDTVGVFQLESRAQMQALPRIKPRSIEDLTVQVAIVRPGPLQGNMVHPYIRRRNNEEEVKYIHPSLEPILKETLGIILFQEQVLQVATRIGGLTEGEADKLRRSMSRKRSKEEIEKMRNRFLLGAQKNGIDEKTANEVFDAIKSFAEYGFCKSHAAGFALLSYQSAWLKRYYPLEFYTALLNNEPMGFYRIDTVVNDAKRHGIEILYPHINRSEKDCTIEEGKIRLGLRFVKNLGERTVERILNERKKGPYESLKDFVLRVGCEKDATEALILSGAFDFLGKSKRALLFELEEIKGISDATLKLAFEEPKIEFPPFSNEEIVDLDYRILGLSPSFHPIKLLRDRLSGIEILKTTDIFQVQSEKEVMFLGLAVSKQRPETAKGFSFITLEDEYGMVNVVIRPKVYERFREIIRLESIILIKGKVEKKDGVINIIADEIFGPDKLDSLI
ncbi:MAG: DNA polymerase III subunit alpha [Deltaproteobacteria bacterium]|nr:DNA polymerase III subunit alpha [Deltaproteobacteria bacterium]